MDAEVLRVGLAAEIARVEESGERVPAESMKVMEALAAEESDVVTWLGNDGSISLRSIVVCVHRSVSPILKSVEYGPETTDPAQIPPLSESSSRCQSPASAGLAFRCSTASSPRASNHVHHQSTESRRTDCWRPTDSPHRSRILSTRWTDETQANKRRNGNDSRTDGAFDQAFRSNAQWSWLHGRRGVWRDRRLVQGEGRQDTERPRSTMGSHWKRALVSATARSANRSVC